jgi:O-acetyl-ADP-ribose deacetylase (regulator of RNase III)
MESIPTTSATINGRSLELVLGDITRQRVDAIVNAANSRLAGGGGVDGAIHRAGGPTIMEETRRRYPNGCPTGSAVITAGGNLPAKFVIHAVGPVWNDGRRGEEDILMAAYRTSLQLAADHACQSVALPALSTGAYRYPIDKAARAAVRAAAQFLRELPGTRPLATVQFVLFSEEALQAFERALRAESGPAVETRPR